MGSRRTSPHPGAGLPNSGLGIGQDVSFMMHGHAVRRFNAMDLNPDLKSAEKGRTYPVCDYIYSNQSETQLRYPDWLPFINWPIYAPLKRYFY